MMPMMMMIIIIIHKFVTVLRLYLPRVNNYNKSSNIYIMYDSIL